MVVNDDALNLNQPVALRFFASKLAPTESPISRYLKNNKRCSHARYPNWHQPDLLEQ
jgi:hypothetical protein